MNENVVSLAAKKTQSIDEALEILDLLKEEVRSGKVKFFVAVAVAPDHSCYCWQATTQSTTELERMGAAARLEYLVQAGET